MKHERQISLLDLEPQSGPTPRQELHWHLFYRNEFQRTSETFYSRHGYRPIFWSRFVRLNCDLFMTSPTEVLIISLSSGELLTPEEYATQIWGLAPNECTVERKRHLSSQVVGVLNARLPRQSWQPEIMEHITFVPERKHKAMSLLQSRGLTAIMDRAWFKNVVRVFGPPDVLRKAYKDGADSGCFK